VLFSALWKLPSLAEEGELSVMSVDIATILAEEKFEFSSK
jgi:hypothetical protein